MGFMKKKIYIYIYIYYNRGGHVYNSFFDFYFFYYIIFVLLDKTSPFFFIDGNIGAVIYIYIYIYSC